MKVQAALTPSLLLILCFIVFSAGLQLGAPNFIYLKSMMLSEPWRWWTAHWVHVGWRHYALNMLAFILLVFIFPHVRVKTLVLCLLVLPVLVSAGIYFLMPGISAYAGLSGILHGIFVLAAIESLFVVKERKFALLVLAVVVLKVVWEKIFGSESAELIQAPVLVEAHQLGLLSGLLVAGMQYIYCQTKHYTKNKT